MNKRATEFELLFSTMDVFSGGNELLFIKFLLKLETEAPQYPWMFIWLPLEQSIDFTAPLKIQTTDPNYFNALRVHTTHSNQALEAIKFFQTLLGAEPRSIVSTTLSNIRLTPRQRVVESIRTLITFYTKNLAETEDLYKKILFNLPDISHYTEIDSLADKILLIIKHLNCLDIFYSSRLQHSCKLPDSTAITSLLQKLRGDKFFTARERIQTKVESDARKQLLFAETLRLFHADRGQSEDSAGAESDTERDELADLDTRYRSGATITTTVPSSLFSSPPPHPAHIVRTSSSSTSPPLPFPPPPPPRVHIPPLPSTPRPSNFGSSSPHTGGNFYTAMLSIRERAQQRRLRRRLEFRRDLAAQVPPTPFSFAEAVFTLREAIKIHNESWLLSTSHYEALAALSDTGPRESFSARLSAMEDENRRLREQLQGGGRASRGRSEDRSTQSHPVPSRQRVQVDRPQDRVKICFDFNKDGCRRGDACRYSHVQGAHRERSRSRSPPTQSSRGERARSPHPRARANAALASSETSGHGEEFFAFGGGGGGGGVGFREPSVSDDA